MLDDSSDEVALSALVHLIDAFALCLAQLVLHDLLERLSGDPAEGLALRSVLPLVDHVPVLVEVLGIHNDLAGLGVDRHSSLFGSPRASLVGGDQRVGEGIENRINANPLLPGEDLNGLHHRIELHYSPSVARFGGLFPREHRPGGEHVPVGHHETLVFDIDREGLIVGVGDNAAKCPISFPLIDLQLCLTTHRLDEMAGSAELSLQPGRGDLQLVAAIEIRFVVEEPRNAS